MHKFFFGSFLLVLLSLGISAQTTDKTVEKIRTVYNEVSEKAKAAETDDEQGQYGDLVVNELTMNSRNHSWAAVGIYQIKYKFFYSSEETENGRVEVLAKVVVKKSVSNRNYLEEYLYNKKGALLFYFQKTENDDQAPVERRIYFSMGKPIRIIEDDKKRDKLTVKDSAMVKEILLESGKIVAIFKGSIKL